MKTEKKVTCAAALFLLFLFLYCPAPAFAKGPLISGTETETEAPEGPALESKPEEASFAAETGGSEETLLDSCIEYGELEALIRRGNAAASNQQESYQSKKTNYQAAYDALVKERRQLLNEAEEWKEEENAENWVAFYEQNAQIVENSAKQLKRTLNTLTSASSESSRNQTVWSIVKSAQTLFASCKQLETQSRMAEKSWEAAQAAYERKKKEWEAGLATEQALWNAEKSLLSAQISMQSVKDSEAQGKRQLFRLLGVDSEVFGSGEESLTLGEIPAVTEEELTALNPETEKESAVLADSGVKSVKNSSAKGDAARTLRQQQLEEAKGSARVTAEEQYANLTAAALLREGAKAAWEAATQEYHAAQTKYQAGMLNPASYLSAEASYLQKKADYVSAEAQLRLAYDSYNWLQKGVK